MSNYLNVTVTSLGKNYITGATASISNGGAKILVTPGTVAIAPVAGDTYTIKNGELLDTRGTYISGTAPYVFENRE